MTAPRPRDYASPQSQPDRLPPRRGGGSSPSTYAICAAGRLARLAARAAAAAACVSVLGALALPATAQPGDPPTVNLGISGGPEHIGLGPLVWLSSASEETVTVTWTATIETGDTAEPADFTDLSTATGTLTFLPGTTSKPLDLSRWLEDDMLDEDEETFTVTLSDPMNATLGSSSTQKMTIRDNDPEPSLSVDDVSGTEGTALTFTVTLSAESGKTVTVDWATSVETGDTATSGTDFTADSGTLTFEPGDPGDTQKTFTVTTEEDTTDEPNETFTVTLSNESNASISDATAKGMITDDDPPTVNLGISGGPEHIGLGPLVWLSSASEETVTVTWAATIEPGDTAEPADFTDLSTATGTLTFLPGTTSKPLDLSRWLEDDMLDEDEETFTVTLSDPMNATLGSSSTQKMTIRDNDPEPSLSVDDVSGTEGTALTFTVTLSAESGKTVTVDWATSVETGDTATSGTDFTADSGTLTFEPGDPGDTQKTFTVQTTEDIAEEMAETFTVTLSNESNASISDATAKGTINDNDGTMTPAINVAPVFADATATRDVPENSAVGTSVGAVVTATDADDDTLTYSLEGTDAASFAIDSGTGQIKT